MWNMSQQGKKKEEMWTKTISSDSELHTPSTGMIHVPHVSVKEVLWEIN